MGKKRKQFFFWFSRSLIEHHVVHQLPNSSMRCSICPDHLATAHRLFSFQCTSAYRTANHTAEQISTAMSHEFSLYYLMTNKTCNREKCGSIDTRLEFRTLLVFHFNALRSLLDSIAPIIKIDRLSK